MAADCGMSEAYFYALIERGELPAKLMPTANAKTLSRGGSPRHAKRVRHEDYIAWKERLPAA